MNFVMPDFNSEISNDLQLLDNFLIEHNIKIDTKKERVRDDFTYNVLSVKAQDVVRKLGVLKNKNICKLSQLTEYREVDLIKIRGCGEILLLEIRNAMNARGLYFIDNGISRFRKKHTEKGFIGCFQNDAEMLLALDDLYYKSKYLKTELSDRLRRKINQFLVENKLDQDQHNFVDVKNEK